MLFAGASAPNAYAASDYLLTLPPAKGEAATAPITVDSWSFGVCNSGQCTASGLRESPTRASSGRSGVATGAGAAAGGAALATGDVDGDGRPDFAYSDTQDSIYGLSFTVDSSPPIVTRACATGKVDGATLTRGEESYVVSSASVVCTGRGGGAAAASYARAGINRIDSTPARISTNLTVGRQTPSQSFGERCAAGQCAAGGLVEMTFSGGQMKHTKTGHVTLLK